MQASKLDFWSNDQLQHHRKLLHTGHKDVKTHHFAGFFFVAYTYNGRWVDVHYNQDGTITTLVEKD